MKTTRSQIQKWLPQRRTNPNKFENGYVFGIAGSKAFPGAAVLPATAAARIGAGGVKCLVPSAIWPIVAAHVIEIMLQEGDDKAGEFSLQALTKLPPLTEKCKAGWIGCGMGRSQGTMSFIKKALEQINLPLVLDADALYAMDPLFIQRHSQGKWILTPHWGEFQRLLGLSSLPQEPPLKLLQESAQQWNCVILLKGFPSFIAGPNGEIYENPTGHTAASTAGCGDVLAGICAGLLAQELSPLSATVVGMYLAGLASDTYNQTFGGHTLMASDILNQIPVVLGKAYGE